jgi:hypothetical protein
MFFPLLAAGLSVVLGFLARLIGKRFRLTAG